MGNSICFWTDLWDLGILQCCFPQLFSFVQNKKIFVRKFLTQDAYANFFTSLPIMASDQLDALIDLIQDLEVDENSMDQWSYI